MITIKLGELKGITKGLEEILGKELPIKPAYWFGKLTKNIQQEVHLFEAARRKLIEKHGQRDADGKLVTENNRYMFTDTEAFNAEYNELANTDVEIDFKPILLDSLGDVKISPITMIGLEKFMVVEDA